jgi:hypothetical protein
MDEPLDADELNDSVAFGAARLALLRVVDIKDGRMVVSLCGSDGGPGAVTFVGDSSYEGNVVLEPGQQVVIQEVVGLVKARGALLQCVDPLDAKVTAVQPAAAAGSSSSVAGGSPATPNKFYDALNECDVEIQGSKKDFPKNLDDSRPIFRAMDPTRLQTVILSGTRVLEVARVRTVMADMAFAER